MASSISLRASYFHRLGIPHCGYKLRSVNTAEGGRSVLNPVAIPPFVKNCVDRVFKPSQSTGILHAMKPATFHLIPGSIDASHEHGKQKTGCQAHGRIVRFLSKYSL
jgi:hypothetical protein